MPKLRIIPVLFLLSTTLVLQACSTPRTATNGDLPAPEIQAQPPESRIADAEGKVISGDQSAADLILKNANIITMDDNNPNAEAIAIADGKILFVGLNADTGAYQGENTQVIDIQGKTIIPGFIDSHAHWINSWDQKISSPEEAVQFVIEQGWTSIDELYADEYWLGELARLDDAGCFRSG